MLGKFTARKTITTTTLSFSKYTTTAMNSKLPPTANLKTFSTISKFPYPSPDEEEQYLQSQVDQIKAWWDTPRYKGIKRPYSAKEVAKHRGTLPEFHPSSFQADKLFNLLHQRQKQQLPVHTIGLIDPVQMTQTVKNQEVIYVSGWACSSTLTTTNEVSPDFGDYPYDTVPNQVERLFKAQQFHDKKAWHEWNTLSQESKAERIAKGQNRVDYLRPIIADGDTGHGGITAVMRLVKLFAEKGAAAVHLEDQLHGGKKCGHLAGKVLVPTSTHVARLVAARLQWDIMGTNNLLIARTDSESGNLLSSSVDPFDHEFIKGVIDPEVRPLHEVVSEAKFSQGVSNEDIAKLEDDWLAKHKLYTIKEAVKLKFHELGKPESLYDEFLQETFHKNPNTSLFDVLQLLKQDKYLGVADASSFHFDWDAPRTSEGYYMTQPGIDVAVKRALSFAPYSDLVWLETKTPDLEYAQSFARRILAHHPNKVLVYNLSPSFNWLNQGFTKQDLQEFIWQLAKAGFTLQLVSLAGLHLNGLKTWELSKAFKEEGMKAYVELVQQPEKDSGADILTHQKWSGVSYVDSLVNVVQGAGSSQTSALGKDSTENQF